MSHLARSPGLKNTTLSPIRLCTYRPLNQFLAKDQQSQNSSIYTRDPTDRDRLARQVHPLNSLDYIHIQQEGDVVRDFMQNIAGPVSLAWQRYGHFIERSESGPPGPANNVTKTVDHLYSWQPNGFPGYERCQAIGELKKATIIKIHEWSGDGPKSELTKRLGKEMRG
jgi:hypothetical protein